MAILGYLPGSAPSPLEPSEARQGEGRETATPFPSWNKMVLRQVRSKFLYLLVHLKAGGADCTGMTMLIQSGLHLPHDIGNLMMLNIFLPVLMHPLVHSLLLSSFLAL